MPASSALGLGPGDAEERLGLVDLAVGRWERGVLGHPAAEEQAGRPVVALLGVDRHAAARLASPGEPPRRTVPCGRAGSVLTVIVADHGGQEDGDQRRDDQPAQPVGLQTERGGDEGPEGAEVQGRPVDPLLDHSASNTW